MPLEAGSIFVRIAGLFDKSEFDKADKAIADRRAAAKVPITYTIGLDDSAVPAEAAAAHAEAKAGTEKPVDIPVKIDGKGLAAEIAAAREAVKRSISPTAAKTGGDPFQLSLSNEDRGLLRSFVEAKGREARTAGTDAVSGAQGGSGRDSASHLGLGRLLGGLLHAPGGFKGMGGLSLGTMIGLGPEHLLTAGGAFAGTLGPATAGLGLAAGGALSREVVGGGADALIQHTTRSNTEKIYQLEQAKQIADQKLADRRDQVIRQYGTHSRQATAARQIYSVGTHMQTQMFNQAVKRDAGSGVGVDAEVKLAANITKLHEAYQKMSQGAQAESSKIYEQFVAFGTKILPFVIQSAQRNLAIMDKAIKPLFAWLGGPTGMGIFKGLENDFAKNLPTSIHMFTQAFELLLKLFGDASAQSGGLSKKMDKFFTKENAKSASDLDHTVTKMMGTMHDWGKLMGAIGRAMSGLLKNSAHEGVPLLLMLTRTVNKFDEWERSAKGSKFLHTFFAQRATELMAILHTIGPVVKIFFQFYQSVQVLIPGVTEVFVILTKILKAISSLVGHSKVINDALLVPLGMFLLLWKRFGWEKAAGVVKNLASGFKFLGEKILGAVGAQKLFNREQAASGVEGEAGKGGGVVSKLLSKIPGGGTLSKLLGKFGGSKDIAKGSALIGGSTGMGVPGTRTNPLVTTAEAGKFSNLGPEAEDAQAAEKTAVAGEVAGAGTVAGEGAVAGEVAGGVGAGVETAGIAAALAPVAPFALAAVGLGAAIYAGIKIFGGSDKKPYSTTEAAKATAGFGKGQTQDQLRATIAAELKRAAHDEQTHTKTVFGGTMGSGSRTVTVGPTAANQLLADNKYALVGQQMEQQLQAGWQQYAHKDVHTIFDQFQSEYKGAKTKTQAAGAENYLAYVKGLISKKELGPTALKQTLGLIEREFPKLTAYLGKNGRAAAVSMTGMIQGQQKELGGFITGPHGIMALSKIVVNKATDINTKLGLTMGQLARSATSNVKSMRDGANANIQGMVADTIKNLPGMTREFHQAAPKIKGEMTSNMGEMIDQVRLQFLTGVINAKTYHSELKALMASPIAGPRIGPPLVGGHTQAWWKAHPFTIAAKVTKTVGNIIGNAASALGIGPHRASFSGSNTPGGFSQGGQAPGSEFGLTDRMTLVDPAGRPRAMMAGDESIYTRHQRPYVDEGLRRLGFGGSTDLWNRVTTPHSYTGGGSLRYGGGPTPWFASGGNLGPASNRTISGTLSKYGTGALNAIDTKINNLDNKYTMQDNIYTLYNGQGALSTQQLGVLMGIREEEWDLLYGEWLKLPAALKTLQHVAYGPSQGKGFAGGGVRTSVNNLQKEISVLDTLVTEIGSDTKPGKAPSVGQLTKLKQYYKGQTVSSVTSTQRQNQQIRQRNAQTARKNAAAQKNYQGSQSAYSGGLGSQVDKAINSLPGAPSNGTMHDIYAQNAKTMAGLTDQLTKLHQTNVGLTKQINALIPQRQQAKGAQSTQITKQIQGLREQRLNNNDKATVLASQLADCNTTNQGLGVEYQDQAYYARFAKAAAESGLSGKTTQLVLTLRALRAELAIESKLEAKVVSAIDTIKSKLDGAGSGSSLVDELSNYGYDMMDLNTQGGPVPLKYVDEIDKVFKALGIKLPPHWSSASATAQATQGQASLSAFQSSLSSVFGSFGSNFVTAGANPFGSVTGEFSGLHNYGAGAGQGPSVHAGGGQVGPPPTPYGGSSDTNINITQHFGGPAPNPHTYSHGLKYELASAIG